ncbi:MAG TPA: hypothetical protein VFZ21_29135 [Gemmatimonadaceae bacterium]|nr:hypothetical protein [Gemmatimonadaceae bacterium]
MRITNGIIQRSVLANLQLSMRRVLDAQEKAITGKRIHVASDDRTARRNGRRQLGVAELNLPDASRLDVTL